MIYCKDGITIYNGDCREILPTFEDKSFDFVVTDPPFGIDYQSARRIDKTKWKPKIANDKQPFLDWIPDAFRLVSGGVLCFDRWDVENEFVVALEQAGFDVRSQIIWDKVIHGMGDLSGSFAPQHENILFAVKDGYKFPGTRPKSVIRSQRVNAEKLKHPNEKPVGLMVNLIQSVSRGVILDPFMGSGTTLVAAKQLGLKAVGIELERKYCDVAIQRLAQGVLL